jgi:hypothetical protein
MGLVERLRHRIENVNRRDLRALIVCVAISATIWTLRTLTEDSTDVIKVPLSYPLQDEELRTLGIKNKYIEIEVKASGFGIIGQRYFRREREVEVPIKDDVIPDSRVSIPTSELRSQLRDLVGADRDIVKIRPDTLHFFISQVVEREVSLRPNYTVQLGENAYLRGEPIIEPPTVLVKGPKLLLDTLTGISTRQFVIAESVGQTVTPQAPEAVTVVDDRTFKATWELDRWSTSSIKVPVLPRTEKEKREVTFLPDSVEVTFITGSFRREQLTPEDFKVVAAETNLPALAKDGKHRVSLKLETIPDGVRDVALKPGRVEFLIYR